MTKALQKKVNAKGKSVLLISDMHAPYQHPDALRFLQAIKDEYAPDRDWETLNV